MDVSVRPVALEKKRMDGWISRPSDDPKPWSMCVSQNKHDRQRSEKRRERRPARHEERNSMYDIRTIAVNKRKGE